MVGFAVVSETNWRRTAPMYTPSTFKSAQTKTLKNASPHNTKRQRLYCTQAQVIPKCRVNGKTPPNFKAKHFFSGALCPAPIFANKSGDRACGQLKPPLPPRISFHTSSTLDFPQLWSPMTAIWGSGRSWDMPCARSSSTRSSQGRTSLSQNTTKST